MEVGFFSEQRPCVTVLVNNSPVFTFAGSMLKATVQHRPPTGGLSNALLLGGGTNGGPSGGSIPPSCFSATEFLSLPPRAGISVTVTFGGGEGMHQYRQLAEGFLCLTKL